MSLWALGRRGWHRVPVEVEQEYLRLGWDGQQALIRAWLKRENLD